MSSINDSQVPRANHHAHKLPKRLAQWKKANHEIVTFPRQQLLTKFPGFKLPPYARMPKQTASLVTVSVLLHIKDKPNSTGPRANRHAHQMTKQ
jgi:hypothetical protein